MSGIKVEEFRVDYDVGRVRPEAVTRHEQVNETWKMISLKDLGSWSGGGTPSKAKPEYWTNGSIPWVSPKDMKTERVIDSEDHITKAAVEESTAKLIPAGSVLVVTRSGILSHTLPVAITTVPVTVNQDLKAITPKDGVLPEYVSWALRCFAREILNTCSKQGTTVASIETAALHRFEIPLAPLDQQKRIVAEIEKQFSRLDEAVANLKRVKANLKRYKAAVLKAAVEGRLVETEAERARREGRSYETGAELLRRILETRHSQWKGKGKYKDPTAPDTTGLPELPGGWVWTDCDAVLDRIEAGASFTCIERPPEGYETGVLKVSAVTWGRFNELESKTCTDPDRIEGRYLVQEGDFLFSRANTIDLVGACVIVRHVSKRLMLSDKTLRLRISPLVSGEWLLICLRSEWGRLEIERLATGNQESMRNIGQDRIRKIRIPLPPLSEQIRVASETERRFSLCDATQTQAVHNLNRANTLRTSILNTTFRKS